MDADPKDLIGFKPITEWGDVSEAHREERVSLEKIMPRFDLHATGPDAPKESP